MKKFKKFVVAGDVHGHEQDPVAVAAVRDFIADFKPQIRVLNGDLWDFGCLRRGASDEERAAGLAEDWEAGIEFAAMFFRGATTAHFNLGNHDIRMHHAAESTSGVVRDYAKDGVRRIDSLCRKWRATQLPYDAELGIYQIGKLNVVHGYFAGENAARQHAHTYGNVLFNHVHQIVVSPVSSLQPAEARSIGCLCKRSMSYMASKPGKLKWNLGFGYGLLFEDGSYQLFQAREVNGQFVCATAFDVF